MAKIKLTELKKTYPSGATGVSGVNMEIADGEFTVLLGASGSGKTALLRMICGLDNVSEGEIAVDDTVVNDYQPKDRDMSLVVGSAGLYPALNIFDNMAYGLKLRKMPKEEIDDRVYEVARILGLTDVLSRKPKNVSAIERQRACIGRAIARKPKIVILDDPFTDFSDAVKESLREDVLKLQKRLKINFIYATRNPREALELADKIAYFENGKLVQYGTPEELYESPKTVALARLIGNPPINLFAGKLEKEGEDLDFVYGKFKIPLDESLAEEFKEYIEQGKKLQLAVRAEDVCLGEDVIGVQEDVADYGDEKLLAFTVEGDSSAHYALMDKSFVFEKGNAVGVAINMRGVNFFDLKKENNILK